MAWSKLSPQAKSALAMAALSVFMAPFVFMLLSRARPDALSALGFRAPIADTGLAWIAGAVLAAAYVAYCMRIPAVRSWLFRPQPLKLLALILAALAATLEEIAFRKLLMDWIERLGGDAVIQVIVSGIGFGLAHIVWGGLNRNWATAIGAVVATTILGLGLAMVYLLGERNLAPCIISHFLVTGLIEPGLLIGAFGGGIRRKAQVGDRPWPSTSTGHARATPPR